MVYAARGRLLPLLLAAAWEVVVFEEVNMVLLTEVVKPMAEVS